jgi:hypothetical protein
MTIHGFRARARRPAVFSSSVFFMAALIPSACGGSKSSPVEPASVGTTPVADMPVDPPAPAPSGSFAPNAESPPAGGRMAYVQCPEKRPDMCTHMYKPVCAEVDNGVRCVTTPCDSTDKKDYGNACAACADPKVVGHWPVACAELGSDVKPP